MSEMPFGTLSVQMLWKLFYLMHQVESGNLETLCTALPPAACKKHLQGTASPPQTTPVPVLSVAFFSSPWEGLRMFSCSVSVSQFSNSRDCFVVFDLLEYNSNFHYFRNPLASYFYGKPSLQIGNENWVDKFMELFWRYGKFNILPFSQVCKHMKSIVGLLLSCEKFYQGNIFSKQTFFFIPFYNLPLKH